jgi:hypothetical protein
MGKEDSPEEGKYLNIIVLNVTYMVEFKSASIKLCGYAHTI